MSTLRVPISAVPAWDALSRALVGYSPPCAAQPDLWWDTDPEAVEAAVYGCKRCRVLGPCADYADAAQERHGTWAGTDRELRHQPKEPACAST